MSRVKNPREKKRLMCFRFQLRRRSLKVLAAIFLVPLLAAGLVPGCSKSVAPELSTDQMIYEALFLAAIGDAFTAYHVVEHTDAGWFVEYPFDRALWNGWLDGLGGVSMQQVEDLYAINETSQPLNWQPIVTNGQFLPARYGQRSWGSIFERCLAEDAESNVNVRIAEGRGYLRSYYSVSRVAFSSDRRLALVAYSVHCAPLSGGGDFLATFEFSDGRWLQVGWRFLRIS